MTLICLLGDRASCELRQDLNPSSLNSEHASLTLIGKLGLCVCIRCPLWHLMSQPELWMYARDPVTRGQASSCLRKRELELLTLTRFRQLNLQPFVSNLWDFVALLESTYVV